MSRLRYLAAAGILAATTCAALSINGATAATPAGNDLQNDVHASAQSGQAGTANDTDTAAEFDTDNQQVDDVQSQDGQVGDQQSGAADNGQSTSADNQSKAADSQSGDQGTASDANKGADAGNSDKK